MKAYSVYVSQFQRDLSAALDKVALALAISLPWSTSLTGILAAIWLLLFIPQFGQRRFWRSLRSLPSMLPVLLWALALVGMAWSDTSWLNRIHALSPFHKLLFIPPFIFYFRQRQSGIYILIGFVASSTALLILSFFHAAVLWHFWRPEFPGIPVKDSLFLPAVFGITALGLLWPAERWFSAGKWRQGVGAAVLIGACVVYIGFVVINRTALIVMPALTIAFAFRRFGGRGALAGFVLCGLAAALIWMTSPALRHRLTGTLWEARQYQAEDLAASTGDRLEFWKKSAMFVRNAPIMGHGTGSTRNLFTRAAAEGSGASAMITNNPHNQTLNVAIQLGAVGVIVLWAMWLSHLLLFRRSGAIAWVGYALVLQNIISSLFNSHISDFSHGWLYVIGVGVVGGMVARLGDPLTPLG